MVYVVALIIFAALTAVCWFVSVACYRSTFSGPDPAAAPAYRAVAAVAVGVVTLTCFVPSPWGYLLGLGVWAIAAFGGLALPPGKAAVLTGYLAAASAAERLAVLGVLGL